MRKTYPSGFQRQTKLVSALIDRLEGELVKAEIVVDVVVDVVALSAK